ncbi:hypothetical protein [Olsenella profusa]|uniref:Uncharacterized protein n=1 Tax=Olsenella profusa TaxID=138595 RepID=A0ABS2F066_9ACTN|nr:hypothetical protein [Olsenella profusa]MBM6773978.1 hypothetical protein [Olsenella profusa]
MNRRNPAVVAGLAGTLALGAPRAAGALSLTEAIDGLLPTPTIAFSAGVIGGAVLTGAVIGTATLVSRRRARRDAEASSASSLVPTPEAGGSASAEKDRDAESASPAERGAAAGSARRPRHLRTDVPDDEPEAPRAAAPRADAAPADADAPSAPARPGARHAATDYEQIATNYVGCASFRERMAHRAAGVAATLRERMGASRMEGVPVIERADGSVGDVGTSWWELAVGSAPAPSVTMSDLASAAASAAIPSDFSVTDAERLAAAARRSADISRRVALVDEGAYPEHRTVDDLSADDDWAAALRSLDERIAEEGPTQDPIGFIDVAGGADTLDEPDGLEPDTSFIPFKTPAGHPEVVDTDSYVDYLIQDEFSKNSSTAARRSSRRFLRVLEGGTQATQGASRHLADAEPRTGHAAKHFPAPEAAEA